ncbi:MAG TPA: peptidoglycan -binding protein [Thermohalobaculum sp.]|nr:peptidoglycan -binding protein [Thermohalobaculum sp.]
MALSRRSGGRGETNTWPGFVDAMTALLLILMFVLSIFMIIQFTMHEKLTGANKELDDLTRQLAGMANVLALERDKTAALESEMGTLQSTLATQRSETDRLNAALAAMIKARDTAVARADDLEESLASSISEREALTAALASSRSEMDAATEAARLAAARRDAIEAMLADLRQKEAERDSEFAALEADKANALALLAQLRSDKDEWARLQAELESRNLTLEEQRQEAEMLRLAALKQLDETGSALTAEEEARLAEAAAAEALRQKLASSEAELDAMTLSLEQARKEAERTLILLAAAEEAKKSLQGQIKDGGAAVDREAALRKLAMDQLSKARAQTVEEQKQVALLNAQVRELREQIGGLQALLDDSERRDSEAQVQIAQLGERLNAALAQKVGELARFRSVFFEKMDDVLGGRQDIQRVGDRFVFQSEVLFAPGSADLGSAGQSELSKLGAVLREIVGEMPPDLNWILRVDGHTDKIPVGSRARYADNWELSQARALSVVKFLVEREGVPPNRLAAIGFAEFQPIDTGDSPESLARNRRIEFKFTER